jgi:hypothetical protein
MAFENVPERDPFTQDTSSFVKGNARNDLTSKRIAQGTNTTCSLQDFTCSAWLNASGVVPAWWACASSCLYISAEMMSCLF